MSGQQSSPSDGLCHVRRAANSHNPITYPAPGVERGRERASEVWEGLAKRELSRGKHFPSLLQQLHSWVRSDNLLQLAPLASPTVAAAVAVVGSFSSIIQASINPSPTSDSVGGGQFAVAFKHVTGWPAGVYAGQTCQRSIQSQKTGTGTSLMLLLN